MRLDAGFQVFDERWMSEWTPILPGLWWHGYLTKTQIPANSYALRLKDGDLAVISPRAAPEPSFFAATEALGAVTVLVAPNSGHDLGQAAWQEHYPAAATFAPAVAGPALHKAKPKLRPFEPLAKLTERLPAGVQLVDLPGVSAGFTMISIEAGEERALVVDEAVANAPKLFGPAVFRLVFWLTNSGPGLARNKVWWAVFAKDKRGVAKALVEAIDAKKPTVLLPLHGEPIRGAGIETARGMLAPLAAG
jgi:hypothetical protein